MIIVLFVIHLLIAVALIGVVMLQKSEGGALGVGGGGGMSGFMTGRSTANLLTRTTAILGAAFFLTSILLVLVGNVERAPRSIIDQGQQLPTSPLMPNLPPEPGAPAAPAAPVPAVPVAPAPTEPSAPLAR